MARTPIHPGEHFAEELKELSLSVAELARQIAVPVNRITGIINGQRTITADMALRLGHWFGTSPEFCSICKSFMSCAWREQKSASMWKGFPSSRNTGASVASA